MALITAAELATVYETDRDDTALQPFITAAATVTTARLADKGLSDDTLKQVQLYLAAHFCFVTDAGPHETLRVEDVSERFTQHAKNPGLLDSRWGRMAVMLDPSGTLAAMTRLQPPAELRFVSRPE